jgi:ferritin-like metal-binding protein YciE
VVDSARDLMIAGLKDAYAMERQAEDMLSGQARRADDYPQVKAKLQQHAEETRQQQKRLERCLDSLGQSPSVLKDTFQRTIGAAQSLFNMSAQDEIIKHALADYAFEHFEIASYKGLIALAELTGEPRVAEVARQNLREEEAMATWLDGQLATIVKTHASRTERGEVSRMGVA